MSEDDATIALTYEQVAQRFGIEVASAKARARRGNWRRVPGNDGKTVVFVPRDALETEKPKTAETETPQPSLLVGELLRRVATRYDQTADSFLGVAALASIRLWIRFVHPQLPLSCTRFLWTPICPRRDRNDDVHHEADRRSFVR